ncbi:hypothetical protein Maq22A_c27725 [Methylobacterium aquaticum]|uniref:Uncharacterized protein n=1 Tax=Methylobacterium aquaticum TaxID=270351 RepID=A0A1Y0ZBX2_9HYPH|nr:hypothetical protein Maq22A_c27725 [Methylobacterium aquaticum]
MPWLRYPAGGHGAIGLNDARTMTPGRASRFPDTTETSRRRAGGVARAGARILVAHRTAFGPPAAHPADRLARRPGSPASGRLAVSSGRHHARNVIRFPKTARFRRMVTTRPCITVMATEPLVSFV